MSVFHSFTKSSISKCPSFTVSQKVQFPNVRLSLFHKKSNFQMSYCLISSKCHFSKCPTAIVAWKVLLFRIFDFTFGQNVHLQTSVIFQMSYYHSGKKSSSFSKSPTFTAERNVFVQMFKDVRNDFVHVSTVARNVHYLPNVLLP